MAALASAQRKKIKIQLSIHFENIRENARASRVPSAVKSRPVVISVLRPLCATFNIRRYCCVGRCCPPPTSSLSTATLCRRVIVVNVVVVVVAAAAVVRFQSMDLSLRRRFVDSASLLLILLFKVPQYIL